MKAHKDKIVVIGAGNVGEAIAYTLMVRVQANDIVLVDINEDRAKGAALDIDHCYCRYCEKAGTDTPGAC